MKTTAKAVALSAFVQPSRECGKQMTLILGQYKLTVTLLQSSSSPEYNCGGNALDTPVQM